jgi:DEP domain-containing protein 5
MASTQFSNDYVDRDLIRTGISVVVVTASSGVFEVDKELLNLTSENLTNNGIGIDIVCLSKMPLHSVPLFKYRETVSAGNPSTERISGTSNSSVPTPNAKPGLSAPTSYKGSPLISSFRSSGIQLSRHSSSLHMESPEVWNYGIPQWIDLSYWSPDGPKSSGMHLSPSKGFEPGSKQRKPPFVPRVRMYEVQMMGLMEMGMAEISIPWMAETQEYEPHRRRRRKASEWIGSRSLSHSPKLSRRGVRLESASSRDHGLLATGTKMLGSTFGKMDAYDDGIYTKPARARRSLTSPKKKHSLSHRPSVSSSAQSNTPTIEKSPVAAQKDVASRPMMIHAESSPGSDSASIATAKKARNPAAARAARNASYALRGLAPPMRAVASTEINVENAQAQMPKAETLKARPTVAGSAHSIRSLSLYGNVPQASSSNKDSDDDYAHIAAQQEPERPSTPIRITNTTKQQTDTMSGSKHKHTRSDVSDSSRKDAKKGGKPQDEGTGSSPESSGTDESSTEETWDMLPNSMPKSTLPFIRNVNASNPLKGNANRETFFGRWQHLYPRKPRAATVKWRSLCTPASVPLTTEDFPSKDSLETDFDSISYVVTLGGTDGVPDRPNSRDELLREMLALRFAHGYQLVVGPRMNKFEGPGLHDASFFFNPDAKRRDGQYLFMSMGNTIQKLSLLDKNCISVIRYQRKPPQHQESPASEVTYQHLVRTILSNKFAPRTMHLRGFAEQYPWEEADNYLSDHRKGPKNEVQRLRFWRTRFVLLPVEPPAIASRHTAADSEENEEEIHLRGIRALTQIWQKMRYIPPEDRRPAASHRMSTYKPKDRNPLRIQVETLNPSELVATELDKLLAAEEAGDIQTTQLLPEEEQFDRESVKLGKLAAALQGERGIEIKNRRWHLRLHYSCFDGEEFTNWLVQNVRDIDTREEAVEFGNELMKEGLFEHVNSRHNFKDGNFFYSIKSEWRVPKQADSKQSWLPASRRSDKSIPTTPAADQSRDAPATVRTRSSSSLATALKSPEAIKPAPEKKRLAVSLSKMIRLDVDSKKKSSRSEIVTLHYDRLHNPENCYHLELSWLNVTSKLVDDAIVAWTTTAERYGLKLVEVPIVEAAKVPESEPFRAAYTIKLAVAAPKHPLMASESGNVFFNTSSFAPQPVLSNDRHFYQKALLRRFNFVLDLEGISEFPENVEINYSWGRLNYAYTQFVHLSGIILAQLTDQGDILLLANRLYNSRLASAKEAAAKLETTRQLNAAAQNLRPAVAPIQHLRPETQMQASGIIGINVQSPSLSTTTNALASPSPLLRPLPRPLNLPPTSAPVTSINSAIASAINSTSSVPLAPHLRGTPAHTPLATPGPTQAPASDPLAAAPTTSRPASTAGTANNDNNGTHATPTIFDDKISADVFGSRRALASASLATYITPEQIKDDLERFCSDADILNAFYAETQANLAAAAVADAAQVQQAQQDADQDGSDRQQIGKRSTPSSPALGMAPGSQTPKQKKRNSGSGPATSSSLLRPVSEKDLDEVPENGGLLGGIPEMKLPESLHGGRRFWGSVSGATPRRRGEGSG